MRGEAGEVTEKAYEGAKCLHARFICETGEVSDEKKLLVSSARYIYACI